MGDFKIDIQNSSFFGWWRTSTAKKPTSIDEFRLDSNGAATQRRSACLSFSRPTAVGILPTGQMQVYHRLSCRLGWDGKQTRATRVTRNDTGLVGCLFWFGWPKRFVLFWTLECGGTGLGKCFWIHRQPGSFGYSWYSSCSNQSTESWEFDLRSGDRFMRHFTSSEARSTQSLSNIYIFFILNDSFKNKSDHLLFYFKKTCPKQTAPHHRSNRSHSTSARGRCSCAQGETARKATECLSQAEEWWLWFVWLVSCGKRMVCKIFMAW